MCLYYLLRFLCFHKISIWHTWPGCVPSFHGCGWPFCLGLCFLNMLNCFHHWLFQPFFLFLVNGAFCFIWFSILEHMFFNYFTSCGNVNIHHIHIWNNCLCFSSRLNLYYCHRFPMKHLMHLSKLLTISFYVHSNHRCGMHYEDVFYGFLFGCVAFVVTIMVYSFFFLHVSTLWFCIPQYVQYLSIFPILLYVFVSVACLVFYGIESAFLASTKSCLLHTTSSPPYAIVMLTMSSL